MIRMPRVEDFSDRLHAPQVTSRVGLWLGISFGICFLTGFWSHLQQTTPGWLAIPPSPAGLYRVTQGLHIITGTIAVPLLLVKLWSVFPRLFIRPPTRLGKPLAVHLLERASIAALISAGIFQLVSGLLNIVQWYPWDFSFRATHYAVAWVAIGSLLVHIAVKLPVIREALGAPVDAPNTSQPADSSPADSTHGLSRRALLRTTWAAAGLAALLTAGQTVPWLRKVSVFAVRTGEGPQGVPINRTARAAGVLGTADAPGWELELTYRGRSTTLTRQDLEGMRQTSSELPIACVEGWSASGRWSGVAMRDLVESVGAPARSRVFVTSLQTRGAFGTSELPSQFVADDRTLLALRLGGETLTIDHGFPCRIIAPNRPGVWQTKWVTKLEVQT